MQYVPPKRRNLHNVTTLKCNIEIFISVKTSIKMVFRAKFQTGDHKNSNWRYCTKCMLVSRCQKAGQRQSIKIGNRFFESVAKFKYLGTTLTDQNLIHEEIKSRLNSGNACYHSVQSLLSSHLLSSNVKFKIYKTIILPVVLYGVKLGL
jgi:hypothetical protein